MGGNKFPTCLVYHCDRCEQLRDWEYARHNLQLPVVQRACADCTDYPDTVPTAPPGCPKLSWVIESLLPCFVTLMRAAS